MHQKIGFYSKYRDFILLAEIGAFLHDLGKLSKFFVLSKARNTHIKDFHGQILFLDRNILPKNVEEFLFTPLSAHLNKKSIKGIDLSISLSHFLCAHHGCSRCLLDAECPFKDTIQEHPLIKLLKTVDHLDASNPSNRGKQDIDKTVRDNFFLKETEVPVDRLNEMRFSFYKELDKFLERKREISEINKFIKGLGEEYFSNALSETRKYGNDITLLDHSKAVAAYYKAYLFNFLERGTKLPNSFFDVHFRLLSVKGTDESIEEFFSYKIACCNVILKRSKETFLLAPPIKRNAKFLQFLADKFDVKLFKMDDFTPLFSGELNKVFKQVTELKIKDPEDIKEGYSKEKAINDIKKVVLFAELRRKEQLKLKLKSIIKHMKNLKKGSVHNEKNLVKYFRKEKQMRLIEKHLNAGTSIEKIKELYGWKSSKDAEKEVYEFFNEILSPIRPPSPIEMSNYFLREYHKLHSYKKLYEKFITRRPVVLGRLFALFRVLKY